MSAESTSVATFLAANGYGTLGTNVFTGPERQVDEGAGMPAEAIFCLGNGGPPPVDYMQSDGKSIFQAGVQVLVRGNVDQGGGFETRHATAQAIVTSLHRASSGALSGYVSSTVLQSTPAYIGRDDEGHPRWIINLQLMEERT